MDQWLLKIYLAVAAFVSMLVLTASGFLFWQSGGNSDIEKKSDLSANQLAVLPIDSLSATASEAIAEKPLKMVFLGDLMLDRNVGTIIKQRGLAYLFEKIQDTDLLKNKDIVSANLEGALTNNGQHYLPNNAYDFAFSPEIIGQLKAFGFNFFNLANNHLTDQGARGVSETRINLDNLGFNYSGCQDGQTGACSYKIIKINNLRVGLAGFSTVYAKLDPAEIKNIMAELKSKTDLIVVNIHWGSEYQHNFSPYQQELAHALIDSGADIIIGHHPHVVGGLEIYQGKPIFYSLGNFIFDQYFSADTQAGLAVAIDYSKNKISISLTPFKSKQGQNNLEETADKTAFLRKFIGWSNLASEQAEQIKTGEIILDSTLTVDQIN